MSNDFAYILFGVAPFGMRRTRAIWHLLVLIVKFELGEELGHQYEEVHLCCVSFVCLDICVRGIY